MVILADTTEATVDDNTISTTGTLSYFGLFGTTGPFDGDGDDLGVEGNFFFLFCFFIFGGRVVKT